MKKVFAVMSTMLLALACFGLLAQAPVAAAEGKITADPTLAEDEIPMYIMGSIYTTFPNYYDNAAKPDEAWPGAARMYPWNETRLRVAQLDAEGKATGKYYAVYFSGSLKALEDNGDPATGAGRNILFYAKNPDSGRIELSKMELGKWYYNRNAGDPSLSHMNRNVTGEDIEIDMNAIFGQVGDGADAGRMYNRILVFDGEGQMIRGTSGDPYFVKAGADGALASTFAPEFCYVDGKIVKYVEGETTPDKVMVAEVDENGDPVLDESGDPVMKETEEERFLYQRFTWEWFETEPENVNENGYLGEGWDAMKWDYCYEKDGGYMAIAFTAGEGTNEKLNEAQLAIYNETLKANWVAEGNAEDTFVAKTLADNLRRECIVKFRIPADGFTYDIGYLDKGIVSLYACFNDMFRAGYYYGRQANFGEQRTYNFSVSNLKTQDVVRDETSYRIMDGNNTIEIMPGDVFKPADNVVYTGLTRYWGKENDLTSFSASTESCEFYVTVDGDIKVMPSQYKNFGEMSADWVADWNTWAETSGVAKIEQPDPNWSDADIVAKFYTPLGWNFAGTSASATAFSAVSWEKWGWMYTYIYNNAVNKDNIYMDGDGSVASPGFMRDELYAFLCERPTLNGAATRSVSGTWANHSDWSNGKATGWMPATTNAEDFANFTLDTTTADLEQTYKVTFKVVNTVTQKSSELTINYVVTDAYTPFIVIKEAGLNIKSEIVDGKLVINDGKPVKASDFLTAYTGKYAKLTGKVATDVLGRDITYKVKLESDTLDLNAPKEGKHRVTAVVYGESGKYDVVQFYVTVKDRTLPLVSTQLETVYVPYGTQFDPLCGVILAVDNVDGNLFQAKHEWFVDVSKTPVDTMKPGKYTVKLQVYDSAANYVEVSYPVQVGEKPATAADIKDLSDSIEDLLIEVEDLADETAGLVEGVEGLAATLDGLQQQVSELDEKSDDLAAEIAAIKVEVQAAKDLVTAIKAQLGVVEGFVTPEGCGSNSAAFIIQLLSMSSLLVLVLRKKH